MVLHKGSLSQHIHRYWQVTCIYRRTGTMQECDWAKAKHADNYFQSAENDNINTNVTVCEHTILTWSFINYSWIFPEKVSRYIQKLFFHQPPCWERFSSEIVLNLTTRGTRSLLPGGKLPTSHSHLWRRPHSHSTLAPFQGGRWESDRVSIICTKLVV